jgi:hypothetical protein
VVLDGGPGFGVSVGAPVRLRLWGGGEGAGLVRHEDWDSLSDWGQLVRALKLGRDTSRVTLRLPSWASSDISPSTRALTLPERPAG